MDNHRPVFEPQPPPRVEHDLFCFISVTVSHFLSNKDKMAKDKKCQRILIMWFL